MRNTVFFMICLSVLGACSDPLSTGRYMIDSPTAEKTLPNRLGKAELREVSLPQYASDQEIVWQTEDGALRSTSKNVWADNPARAMTLALARQISAVSGATVIAEPWPLSQEPDRRIEVRVEQVLPRADGVLRMSGIYFVSLAVGVLGRYPDSVHRFDIEVPLEGEGPGFIAKAQSAAIGQLAEQIAALK